VVVFFWNLYAVRLIIIATMHIFWNVLDHLNHDISPNEIVILHVTKKRRSVGLNDFTINQTNDILFLFIGSFSTTRKIYSFIWYAIMIVFLFLCIKMSRKAWFMTKFWFKAMFLFIY
jgi:hypothetical protein